MSFNRTYLACIYFHSLLDDINYFTNKFDDPEINCFVYSIYNKCYAYYKNIDNEQSYFNLA